jgi:O-antigen/teichoic acid export membrane protein
LENKAKRFAALKSGSILLNVFFNFLILGLFRSIHKGDILPAASEFFSFYSFEDEIYYVYLANALGNLSVAPFFLSYFRRLRLVFDVDFIKKMLLYASPMVITGLAFNLNEALSRNLIKYLLPENFYPGKTGLEALGIYSANFRFAVFITLAVQAFKFSAEPFFFKKAADKDGKSVFAVVMRYFVLALCVMYVAVSINTDILQYIMGKAVYREGIGIVPILLLANIFLGIYYNLAVWYKVTDKTYFGALINVFSVLITLIANVLLLPHWGYTGSAISTLLCFFSMSALCYYFGSRYYPVPYDTVHALVLLAGSTLLIYALYAVNLPAFWQTSLLKNTVFLTALFLVFLYEKRKYPQVVQRLNSSKG